MLQEQDAAPGRRLAAAALANERQRFPFVDAETDAIDRAHRSWWASRTVSPTERRTGKCLTRLRTSSSGAPHS